MGVVEGSLGLCSWFAYLSRWLGVRVSLVWRLPGFVKTLMTEEIVKIYDYNQPGLRGMRG